ncbi:MAG TPA: class I SAM-dependent methyltransferase, partial [Thermoanaerobaculia bacterium]
EGQFDLILVASLFTHLPPATFTPWLRRLAELLTPNGLLIFSVHDQSLAPVKVDGIAFHSYSESRVLEGEDYGSTWVSEEYVREQVASIGAGHDCVRLPRALSDWQDVYVISPEPIPNPSPRRTPKGFVDQFETEKEGVRISGWAVGAGEEAERVEIRLDDELAAMATHFGVRPDVAAWLGMDEATRSGWEVLIPHSAIRSFRYQVVTISAFTRANEERILFIGTLDSLSGHAAREKGKELERQLEAGKNEIAVLHERVAVSEHQRRTLEQQIAAMQQSRFWRARDQWFAMKRRLGLTDEL